MPRVLVLATLPWHIRGYGHVKDERLAKVRARWAEIEVALMGGKSQARRVA